MDELAGEIQLSERISNAKYSKSVEIERTSKVYTRRLVPADAPLHVLDIGCGTGLNAQHLREAGHSVTGVDISEEAIRRFELAGFEGKKADIEKGLPFVDGSFDVVFASEVIEHVIDTERFLSETSRVLRRGGRLILSTPNSAFWVYRAFAAFGRTVTEVQHPGHVRFFSKRSLQDVAKNAGFVQIEISARHMYLIIDGKYAALCRLLQALGGKKEMRFRTGVPYWHLSSFSRHASGFWADTLILSARKPEI